MAHLQAEKRMTTTRLQIPEQIQADLGQRLQALRLGREMSQAELADSAGISLRTVSALENGEGSTLLTLIRVLKALDALSSLDALAPRPTVRPMAMLNTDGARQRAPRKRR